MKFKLDENLGSRTAELIAESGHDVETVAQESDRVGVAVDDPLEEALAVNQRVFNDSAAFSKEITSIAPFMLPEQRRVRLRQLHARRRSRE
jgi:hypothetical protein